MLMDEYPIYDQIYPFDRTDYLIRTDNPRQKFTDTWTQIKNRLHENSGLRRTENKVSELFDDTIGKSIEKVDAFLDEHLLQSYLLTAEGVYLDDIGEEWGVPRLKEGTDEETDESYRQRILNSIVYSISLLFIKRQGFKVYSKKKTNFDSRLKMTSSNPHSSNNYDFIPITPQSFKFLLEQIIFEYDVQPHIKGW